MKPTEVLELKQNLSEYNLKRVTAFHIAKLEKLVQICEFFSSVLW